MTDSEPSHHHERESAPAPPDGGAASPPDGGAASGLPQPAGQLPAQSTAARSNFRAVTAAAPKPPRRARRIAAGTLALLCLAGGIIG